MKRQMLAIICAAGAALTLATTANALPAAGTLKSSIQFQGAASTVEHVHYRKWRHSHGQTYRRGRAYRGYGYRRGYRNYGYRSTPGIYFNFGGSRYGNRRYDNYQGYNGW